MYKPGVQVVPLNLSKIPTPRMPDASRLPVTWSGPIDAKPLADEPLVRWEKLDPDPVAPSSHVKGWRPLKGRSPLFDDSSRKNVARTGEDASSIEIMPGKKDRVGLVDRRETAASVFFYQGQRLVEERAGIEDWYGSSVIKLRTGANEAAYIGPSEAKKPEVCQDRIGVEYDERNQLVSVALADGVSQSTFPGSVADMAVRLGVRLAAENVQLGSVGQNISQHLVGMLAQIEGAIRSTVPPIDKRKELRDELVARVSQQVSADFLDDDFFDRMMDDRKIGSSTLFLAVREARMVGGQRVDRMHYANIGDGGYAIVGPRVNEAYRFESPSKAPPQLYAGNTTSVTEQKVDSGHIDVPEGHLLLVFTDGVFNNGLFTTNSLPGYLHRLYATGLTQPQDLTRQFLFDVGGGGSAAPGWVDDTAIFCHRAD